MKIRNRMAVLVGYGLAIGLAACSGLKTQQEDPYSSSWEQRLQSEEWAHSLNVSLAGAPSTQQAHYALPNLDLIRDEAVSPDFMKAYPKLVSRAYFRLMAEAMEADQGIRNEYQQAYIVAQKSENDGDPVLLAKLEAARKRYEAHRHMLEGLRSWRSFQKYGSDDLEFFLEEQLRASFALFEKGATEERIVGHLMTGLADLYHKEETAPLKSL